MNQVRDIVDRVAVGVLAVGFVAGTIWASFGVAGASPLTPQPSQPNSIIVGGNTCNDAVIKAIGVAEVDGAYMLRQVHDQGTFGEKYLSEPITVPRLLKAGDEILITGPWLVPGENGGTVTLTVTQFDDGAKIERLATTARDIVRPTLTECTALGQDMPDYYPENLLLDQRAHQPS